MPLNVFIGSCVPLSVALRGLAGRGGGERSANRGDLANDGSPARQCFPALLFRVLLVPSSKIPLHVSILGGGRGRVARPFGFALTDPGRRLSRTRLFPEVTRMGPLVGSRGAKFEVAVRESTRSQSRTNPSPRAGSSCSAVSGS